MFLWATVLIWPFTISHVMSIDFAHVPMSTWWEMNNLEGWGGPLPLSWYMPPELLTYVAGKLGISEAKAYSVASFYENFSFEAKGKYVIKVCDGTACHVRKSIPILEGLYKELGLGKKKHTTDDQLFTVETVSCLGACGLAPAVMVNDEVHPKMTPEKMSELIAKLREDEKV